MFCVTCLICNSIKTLTNVNSSKNNISLCICKKNAWIWKVVLQWNSCLRLIVLLSYSFYTLISMIFVIILFWNWMFLPKQTFAWSPFIILSSSYIALSPLKKKQQNIFFLKLQCEKEGENAIKHKYFMSKIQVRKKFNDQRLLRKE